MTRRSLGIDVDALELLSSVGELGSVSAAARERRISQPSASRILRALEVVLGVTLVERSPTGSRLTPEGVRVAEWGEDVLRALTRLVDGARDLQRPSQRELRVAASLTTAEHLVPAWIMQLRAECPGLPVQLVVENSTRVVKDVREHAVDLGFIESTRRPGALRTRHVGGDELVIVVRPGDRLSTGASLDAGQLAELRCVVREQGSGTREAFEDAVRVSGHAPAPPLLELGSTAAIVRAVLDGAGPGVVSRLAVETELRAGRLTSLRISGEVQLRRRFHAVWPPDVSLSPAAESLLGVAGADASGRREDGI